jgi:hypothetical protein
MTKQLGRIGIDAGLCWIGDPCHVLPNDSSVNPGANWSQFCKTLEEVDKRRFPRVPNRPTTHNFNGIGVCVSTGGDGSYPVTAEIKNGRVESVTVDFRDQE